MKSVEATRRDHIKDLGLKRGDALLGADEEGATDFGTQLGRRILIASLPRNYLIVVDAESPTVIPLIGSFEKMNEEDVYSLRYLEISSEDIEQEIHQMANLDMVEEPEQLLEQLKSGSEPIRRPLLVRALTRICEQSDVFPEYRMSARETFRDVMTNQGANADPEMVAVLTCPECFMIKPSVEDPCLHCGW